jgi:hypothetical protein
MGKNMAYGNQTVEKFIMEEEKNGVIPHRFPIPTATATLSLAMSLSSLGFLIRPFTSAPQVFCGNRYHHVATIRCCESNLTSVAPWVFHRNKCRTLDEPMT